MSIKKNRAKRNYEIVAGADVAKDKIDVSINGEKPFIIENSAAGIAKLIKLLKEAKAELVVLEPTGGYELELMDLLHAAQRPFYRCHPTQFRNYARSKGTTWPRPTGWTRSCSLNTGWSGRPNRPRRPTRFWRRSKPG